MTLTFDRSVYRDLLTQTIPKVIESEQEYEQTLAMVEALTLYNTQYLLIGQIFRLILLQHV